MLKKTLIGLGILVYLLTGNGLGRMSWDVYYGNQNNFGQVDINAMRPILFPTCALFTDGNVCNRSGETKSFLSVVNIISRPVYLFSMTFFWPLKIILNVVGLAAAHLLVYIIAIVDSFISMLFYIYQAFLW